MTSTPIYHLYKLINQLCHSGPRAGIYTNSSKFGFYLFILLLSSAIYHPASVHAVGYGMSIYPPLLRVHIKPGKSISQVFKIDNLTSDDKFFVARIIPFSEADLFGNPTINLKSTAPWLSYFTLANTNIKLGEPFTIKGSSSEQLIIGLSIPADAPVKDLYATLLVSTYANIDGIDYQGSLVSATTGSNLLITVASEAFPPTILRVEPPSPTPGITFKFGNYYVADNLTPLSFSVSASNIGNFTTETKGLFRVTDRLDFPVYLEGILPVNIISQTRRTLLNNDGHKFTFSPTVGDIGLYKATISVKTDNANAENSINLILLPFKAIAGLLFAVIFLVVIYRTTISSKKDVDRYVQE